MDLHAHTLYSDGELTPAALARLGNEAGLSAFALTDHDTVAGFPEFARAAERFEPVCGVEVSSRHEGADVHILGLFVDPEDSQFADRLQGLENKRKDRARSMIERLAEHGVSLSWEAVVRHAGTGTVGRPHVAKALVEAGAVTSFDAAFRKYLRPGCVAYVESPGPEPAEAIRWIHEAGGVAVLAHPGLLRRQEWIELLAEAGLDGLEVWHPRHDAGTREALLRLAGRLDLVPSGGSDYHGPGVGDAVVGQEPVPALFLERLRDRRPHA